MSSFDPMAAAIDWLDAYRAASIEIVDLYADGATLECGCGGMKVIAGRGALIEYWRQRFAHNPAGELQDLQPEGSGIGVSYRVPDGIVQAILNFDAEGKIERSRCGPTAEVVPLRKAQRPVARDVIKPAAVDAVIPLVRAPDDPGPESGLDGDAAPETTQASVAGPWERLKQMFR